MQVEHCLDLIHGRAQRIAAIQYFAAFTRLVLAIGFIAPGMHKVIGHSFITPEAWAVDDPIRLFFEALFSAGELYVFIGVIQTAAGVLLLFYRTAPLGSVLYLPVISGIFFVTFGLHFGATTYIAGSMLLASIFMVCWYYPNWKRLLFPEREPVPSWQSATGLSVACSSWYCLAAAGILLTLVARSVIPMKPFYSLSWVVLGAAILLGVIALAINVASMARRAA
jgi:hypothetical protein